MSYYDMTDEQRQETGIDYDLDACLEYNPQPFNILDIERVLAVWSGENDGDDWRWIILLRDGRYVFLQGGCDYTGWDCQSWATSEFAETAEQAAEKAKGDISAEEGNAPWNAGFGHMLNIMDGTYMANANEVYDSLTQQLTEGKDKTWREKMDNEMGL